MMSEAVAFSGMNSADMQAETLKFLVFSDCHFTMTNPRRRKDVYWQSLKAKFLELAGMVLEHKVDYVLICGDLFNSKLKVKWIEHNTLMDLLQLFSVPVYIIPGNHDLFGANFSTFDEQPIGTLHKSGTVRLVEDLLLEKGGFVVQLHGIPFGYNRVLEDYKFERNPKARFVIAMSHDMLFLQEPPFGVSYLKFLDLLSGKPSFDILFNGHIHGSHDKLELNDRLVQNVSGLSRAVLDIDEKDREVKAILCEVNPGGWEVEDLVLKSVKPFKEVFDLEQYAVEKEKEKGFDDFVSNVIREINAGGNLDLASLIKGMDEFRTLDSELQGVIEEYLNSAIKAA